MALPIENDDGLVILIGYLHTVLYSSARDSVSVPLDWPFDFVEDKAVSVS
jgi:hypothetical protein